MTWTNCGSKRVRDSFDRDRKEIEKERFLQEEIAGFIYSKEKKESEKQSKLKGE